MALFKVEISGVNTTQLPLLTNEEKTELFKEIKKGNKGKVHSGEFETCAKYYSEIFGKQ